MNLADRKHINIKNTNKSNMPKNNIKVIIGGPLGILAWSASAGTMLIIFFWGLEKSALAVIVVKSVSWGMWGVGVIRESPYIQSLKGRLSKAKQIRKSRFRFSWGFTFYLCSMGEWGQLNYNYSSLRLKLYCDYFVLGECASSTPTEADPHLLEIKEVNPIAGPWFTDGLWMPPQSSGLNGATDQAS